MPSGGRGAGEELAITMRAIIKINNGATLQPHVLHMGTRSVNLQMPMQRTVLSVDARRMPPQYM